MCGIFLVSKYDENGKEHCPKDVITEFNMAKQRGPDNLTFTNTDRYFLGFHRLSINGLTDQSNQPFVRNGIYVMCNGEIYNYKQLYNYTGIKPITDSDCEIILDLYLLYPIDYFISMLDGVFAFIIYDTRKNIVIVGRDPFGVRPLFYSHDYKNFSSELKQIHNLTTQRIEQFYPGHFLVINQANQIRWCRYHTLVQYNLSHEITMNPFTYYQALIKTSLISAVKKRLLSDRPIACLLSGGLDSSLITSIVRKLLPKHQELHTFSIGMKGATDFEYAKEVSDYLGTKHTEIILSENEFLDAIPEVIEKIESYDTTTVRASVGNYLISKYIAKNTNFKVIFNGDGSDELTGGYLYFSKAPSMLLFDYEVRNLLSHIHFFDVLRSDRSISSCGLEPRTPFLDKSFVNLYLSIPLEYRKQSGIEKKLLRDSFKEFLPDSVLYRTKEAFSDGVSAQNNSWHTIIQNKLIDYRCKSKKYTHIIPFSSEQKYYRDIFDKLYPNRETVIPYYWMPKWSTTSDPSARTLL